MNNSATEQSPPTRFAISIPQTATSGSSGQTDMHAYLAQAENSGPQRLLAGLGVATRDFAGNSAG